MKKLLIPCLLLCLILTACAVNPEPGDPIPASSSKPVAGVSGSVDWHTDYPTTGAMLENAPLALVAAVTDSREIWADSLACRRYTLQVQTVHKGDTPAGGTLDVIIVNNPGGPQLSPGSSYALCLEPSTRTGCTDAWEIIGVVQGLAVYDPTKPFEAHFE